MAQDRLFHKRLGHSERVNQLSDFEYIVWGCYVMSADDYGVMRFSGVTLQADHDRLLPKSIVAIERALSASVKLGLVEVFEHQTRRYVCQRDWQDYQKIRYPGKSTNPLPPSGMLLTFTKETQDLFRRRLSLFSENHLHDFPQSRAGDPDLPLVNANANGNANEDENGNAAREDDEALREVLGPVLAAHQGRRRGKHRL